MVGEFDKNNVTVGFHIKDCPLDILKQFKQYSEHYNGTYWKALASLLENVSSDFKYDLIVNRLQVLEARLIDVENVERKEKGFKLLDGKRIE